MLRREYYYVLAAFLVGSFIALYLTRPDLTALSKMLATLKNSVKDSESAADEQREEEEGPSFGDFTGQMQDSPALIRFVRDHIAKPPSTGPYKLEKPQMKDFSQFNQSTLANTLIFNNSKKNGYFVEIGAMDGEFYSNTLYFERELGWTGLLIEPNHDTFEKILLKGRKAHVVNAALSPVKSPMDLLFYHIGFKGAQSRASPGSTGMHVDAYPLYSLLAAVGGLEVDFLSMDIERMELKVLRTIPWDKVKIHVMCIDKTGLPIHEMAAYLGVQGYKHIGNHFEDAWFVDMALWNKTKSLKL